MTSVTFVCEWAIITNDFFNFGAGSEEPSKLGKEPADADYTQTFRDDGVIKLLF